MLVIVAVVIVIIVDYCIVVGGHYCRLLLGQAAVFVFLFLGTLPRCSLLSVLFFVAVFVSVFLLIAVFFFC